MPCYALDMTTAKSKDRETSRDKEHQPEWGRDRCRCVCLYTSECSETQECIPPRLYKTGQVTSWAGVHSGGLQRHKQHNIFFAASILAYSNFAGWDTDAGVKHSCT
ncbi:uncharacterized protein B0T23DRAFT_406059 [Neurospora hispaniola]|uniref:Uncharacterized protein n=1 Tax=Neurospora hispaniola TaxID=588809 RepID=A0AAJ0I3B0_9PEZI|nr:hypothetical protein B0T23DRAFT_406059 [Neurospora hispaniola]